MSESLHVEESISSSEITDSDIGNKKKKRKKERFLPTCNMSRENCLSSSSSSKSSTVLTIDKFPPLQASDWKLKHLLKIGIAYADSSLTLSDFVSALKVKPELVRHGFTELPVMYNAVCSKLTEISKDVWDFSFDMDKFVKCQSSMLKMGDSSTRDAMILEQMDRLESAIKSLEDSKQELRACLSDLQINDAVDSLFSRWFISLLDFWDSFHTFLSRCLSSHHGNTDIKRGSSFTFLFMELCKIFFLRPEPGKVQPEMVNVKSTVVRGYPDVRFLAKGRESWIQEAWHVGLKGQRVLIVTEIKDYKGLGEERHTESCDEEFSINTHLSKEVLGQHGIQLLMERDNSFFAPGVVGIIIIRTKIIFTYLEVTPEHFLKIMEKGEVDSPEAIIFYTRPFDYLNATDRQEIYEHMFWFGFIQSSYRMKKLTTLSQ